MSLAQNTLNPPPRTVGREYYLTFIVGVAHMMSHFCQLVLVMLSFRLTAYFGVDTIAIGFVVSTFAITSCLVQAASGFIVDKIGARPILFFGLIFMVLGLSGYALSTQYWMLFPSAIVLGIGTGIFHPVDYTLLNKLVTNNRLGMAYSIHGLTGNLGWALTPLVVVPVAAYYDSWQHGVWAAVIITAVVLLVVLAHYRLLDQYQYDQTERPKKKKDAQLDGQPQESAFAFLKLPVIWLCMLFFFFYAMSNNAIQTFSKDALQGLFDISEKGAAYSISIYMFSAAAGTLFGGYLTSKTAQIERIVGIVFACSASIALMIAFLPLNASMVYVAFATMGFFIGIAGPSRDLIVRRSTPPEATGRVFGIVYAGLDIGAAVAPLIYATLIDHQLYSGLFITLAVVQMFLITSAFNVRRGVKPALNEPAT